MSKSSSPMSPKKKGDTLYNNNTTDRYVSPREIQVKYKSEFLIAPDGTFISRDLDIFEPRDKKLREKLFCRDEFVSMYPIRSDMLASDFYKATKYNNQFTKFGKTLYAFGTVNPDDIYLTITFRVVDKLEYIFNIAKELEVKCDVGNFLSEFDNLNDLEKYLKNVNLKEYRVVTKDVFPFTLTNLRKCNGARIIRHGDKIYCLSFNPLKEFIYNAAKGVQSNGYLNCFGGYKFYSRYDHARTALYYTEKAVVNNVTLR